MAYHLSVLDAGVPNINTIVLCASPKIQFVSNVVLKGIFSKCAVPKLTKLKNEFSNGGLRCSPYFKRGWTNIRFNFRVEVSCESVK